MPCNASILGCEGLTLSLWEKSFFADVSPFGFILFARNIDTPDQLKRLTSALRDSVGWEAPILIDQEGGRVQRLRAPHWREYLPALDQMQRARDPMRAQYLRNRLIAHELMSVGIDVNCAPLADVVERETHPVLRNRLYGDRVETVVQAAQVCADALLDGGVLPIIKHLPGYGRAVADSHVSLSHVSEPLSELHARDFAPFKALNYIKMGMTAHVVFEAVDPQRPITSSPKGIKLIREDIGFSGLLMSDDISMGALSGDLTMRTRNCLEAGCDIVLHCNGKAQEMQEVTSAAGEITPLGQARCDAALAQRGLARDPLDLNDAERELEALVS